MKAFKSSAKIIWTYGLIFGICFGIIMIITELLALKNVTGSLLTWVRALLFMPLFLAGVLAAKRTGLLRTGTLAGILAGLTGGLITIVSSLWTTRPVSLPLIVVVALVGGLIGGALFGEMGGSVGYKQYIPQEQ
jgi:hypothetical protein